MNRGEFSRVPRLRLRLRLWLAIGLGGVSVVGSVVLVIADVIGRGALWAGHAGVSALPLLLIGAAIAAVTVAVPRGARQVALRLVAALAFVAWGLSQLARSPQLAGVLDDLAILLFVIDAAIAVVPEARQRLEAYRRDKELAIRSVARGTALSDSAGRRSGVSDPDADGLALEGGGSRR